MLAITYLKPAIHMVLSSSDLAHSINTLWFVHTINGNVQFLGKFSIVILSSSNLQSVMSRNGINFIFEASLSLCSAR